MDDRFFGGVVLRIRLSRVCASVDVLEFVFHFSINSMTVFFSLMDRSPTIFCNASFSSGGMARKGKILNAEQDLRLHK